MSQFLSNKYLKYRGLDQTPAKVIDSDRPCTRCDYNLRGLMNNGVCPECGTAIKVSAPSQAALLADAPLSDIRALAQGLWLGIASVVLAPPVLFFIAGAALQAGRSVRGTITTALMIVALIWCVAVWRMMPVLQTPEGVRHGFTPNSRLRQVARYSQLTWPTIVLLVSLTPATTLTRVAVLLLVLVGLGGLVAMSLMLSRLADWAVDESAGKMLNITVWLLPLSTGILLLSPFFSVAGFLSCIAIVMWMVALGTFGLALLSLAMSASWSQKHARDQLSKTEQMRQQIVRRPPPPPRSDEPIRLAEPGDPLPQVGLVDRETLSSAAPVMDEIVRDVPCTHCGYNVRGLKVYGRCPECGERIASA